MATKNTRRIHPFVSVTVGIIIGALGTYAHDGLEAARMHFYPPPPPYSYSATAPDCSGFTSGWIETNMTGTTCSTPSSTVIQVLSAPGTAQLVFVSPGKAFPTNYRATVTISQMGEGLCAGILIRGDLAQETGYTAFVCSNGTWQMTRFDPGVALPFQFSAGRLPASAQQIYTVTIVTQGTVFQLLVNGVFLAGGDEDIFASTKNVNLVVSPVGSATFSDFSINQV